MENMNYVYRGHNYLIHTNNKNLVIATSNYGRRTYKGVARCSSEDEFDLTKGVYLAVLRCAQKIANKRYTRSVKLKEESEEKLRFAQKYCEDMEDYVVSATDEVKSITEDLSRAMMEFDEA